MKRIYAQSYVGLPSKSLFIPLGLFVTLLQTRPCYSSLLLYYLEAMSQCDLNPSSSHEVSLQYNVTPGSRSSHFFTMFTKVRLPYSASKSLCIWNYASQVKNVCCTSSSAPGQITTPGLQCLPSFMEICREISISAQVLG